MDETQRAIEQVLSGDADGFRVIVEQYQGLVFTVCLNISGDRFEAENLAQEAFLQAYRSLSSYGGRGFKAWLMRIAANKCNDWLRKRTRQREEPLGPEDFAVMGLSSGESVEDAMLFAEDSSEVRRMCGGLPDIYRTVVEEYYLHEKSIRTIAMEIGANEKTVETRLYRGIKLLRERYREVYS